MKKIAIFASGNGSNYEALANACQEGKVNAQIVLVVVDNPNAYVIERAKKYGHTVFVFNPQEYQKKRLYEDLILNELTNYEVELICFAGYMRIVSKYFLNNFPGKIMNIHPALLPSFKGAHAIRDAYEFGVKVFGVTIHFIDEKIDGGIIIDQDSFRVEGNISLAEVETKIHEMEHRLYPQALQTVLMEE